MALFKVLLKSWQQQWRQILLVVFGLLCASSGLSSVLALNATAKQKMSQLSTPFVGKPQSIATLSEGKVFSKQNYAHLLNQGWQVIGLFRFELSAGNTSVSVVGVDVASLLTQMQLARNTTAVGDPDGSKNATFAESSAGSGDLSLWQAPLMSPAKHQWFVNNAELTQWPLASPVAVPQINDDHVYVSMSAVGTLEHTLNINELWIFSPVNKHQAQHLAAAGFDLQLISSDTGTLTDSFYINITAMGLLMFAVSMFISLNAYNLLFGGRKSLIRQLYLMGVDTRQLKYLFALECNLLTLVCCTIGFVLGLALAQLISPGMEMTLRNLYDANFTDANVSFMRVRLMVVVSGLLAANLILWFPLDSALKQLNQIDRMASGFEYISRFTQVMRKHSLWIAVCMLFAMIIWLRIFPDNGLLLSFLLITGCVLCGCAIVLLLIPKVLNLVKQQASPEWPMLFYYCADAVRLSDKSRIAICAFFIAITANIGMNLMVGSFRQATDTWIQQQFVADYYLSTNEPEKFQGWAAQQKHVDVYHRARSELVFEGRKTEVLPMPKNLTGHLPLLFKAKAADVFSADIRPENSPAVSPRSVNTVFINEQMSVRHKLRVSQKIQINQQDVVIAGIYYDYGNMFNQILVDDATAKQFHVDNKQRQLFSISLTHQEQDVSAHKNSVEALRQQLDEIEVNYYSGAQIKEISMNVFEQTFVITSGLNLITLLVAGASLATSILIIEGQNNQQTRILHQLGISNLKVWLGSLMQYGYLITLVFVLSIPFGMLLSYQLINNINYSAFQWSYPLQHDLVSYWFVYGISLLTVLLAVSLPFALKTVLTRKNRGLAYG